MLVSFSSVSVVSMFFFHSCLSGSWFLQVRWLTRLFWLGFVFRPVMRFLEHFVSFFFILALAIKGVDVLDQVLNQLCFIEVLWLLFVQAPWFVLLVRLVSLLPVWSACSLTICLWLSVVVWRRSIIVWVLATSCPPWPRSFLRTHRSIGSVGWLTVWFDNLLRFIECKNWQLLIPVALHLLMVMQLPSAILKRLHFVAKRMLLTE